MTYSKDVDDDEPQDEGYEVESVNQISYMDDNVQEKDYDNNSSKDTVFRAKSVEQNSDGQTEEFDEEPDVDLSHNPSFPRNYNIDPNLSNDIPSTGDIVRGYSSDDQSNDVVSLNQSYFDSSKLDATIPYVTPTNSPGILRANSDDESFDSHVFVDKDQY
jgi:hypothetical protein